jgi:hypothetical protein
LKTIKRPNNKIVNASVSMTKRLMISVPLTGLIRAEWALARYGQVIPCNWSQVEVISWMDMFSPMGYLVADARNIATHNFIKGGFEWLFFIDHDVILPPNTFVKLNEYMLQGDIPIFGGLYFTKSMPSEPLMYRGIGTSHYRKWKLGDKVWIDGMGMGCTVIHRSIMQAIYAESPEYNIGSDRVRKVFETPGNQAYDAEKAAWITTGGTEDLTFYQRLKTDGLLKKAGWPKYQKMQYPYLCDTSIFCKHIDWNGIQYPSAGEEKAFMKA